MIGAFFLLVRKRYCAKGNQNHIAQPLRVLFISVFCSVDFPYILLVNFLRSVPKSCVFWERFRNEVAGIMYQECWYSVPYFYFLTVFRR